MTDSPVSGWDPGVMGGPEPEGEHTEVMGGHVMGGPEPEREHTDVTIHPEPDEEHTDVMGGPEPG